MKSYSFIIVFTLFISISVSIAKPSPSSDSITIKINIPSVFTPDAHLPEKFCVQKSDSSQIVKFEMKIYNRWGELLFESKDITKCWDGTYKGQICQMDAYVFQITMDLYDQVAERQLNGYKYNGTVVLAR